jgi:HlyD family secretion protein
MMPHLPLRLTLLCAILLAACARSPESTPSIGYVEAEWTYISAPDAGWLIAPPAARGSLIKAGDTLFQLDRQTQIANVAEAESRVSQSVAQGRNIATGARAPDLRALEARAAEARARFALARNERDRHAPLVAQGIESKSQGDKINADFDATAAALTVATANITVARQAARPGERSAAAATTAIAQAAQSGAEYRLAQRTVIAVVGGRVQEVFRRVGEYVTPGTPILALLPDDALNVRFFVPQNRLPTLSLGKQVTITADGLSQPIAGTVTFIATEAEYAPPVIYSRDQRAKLVFLVEARIPAHAPLLPGLPVEVRW